MLCLFKLPPNVCCLSPHAQGLRGRCVGSCETPFRVCFNNSCNRQHLSEKLNVSRFSMNITLHLLCICWRYNIFFSRYCLYKTHGSGFFFFVLFWIKTKLKKIWNFGQHPNIFFQNACSIFGKQIFFCKFMCLLYEQQNLFLSFQISAEKAIKARKFMRKLISV